MTDEELIARLRTTPNGVRNGFRHLPIHRPSDYVPLEAADRIEALTAKLKLFEKVEMYLKTMYPEKSGSYFICGEGGVKDGNGLPERLHICPAYGADWMMLYTRSDKTSGPEY